MHSELPFLAPWTALLAVQVTIYRSVRNGLQTWVASGIGVGVSFLIGSFLGVNVWTFALAVFVGLVGARIPRLRTEGAAIATTAIFVLGSGFGDQAPLLNDRLLEVGIGVIVGLLVNLLLPPPLRDRQAAWQVDNVNRRMGEILIEMADALQDSWDADRADAWINETVALDQQLRSVGQTVQFARESTYFNPRQRARSLRPSRRRARAAQQDDEENRASYEEILARVGEGVSHLRNLARTLRESTSAERQWDGRFRGEWLAILRDAGHSLHDPDVDVEPVVDRLTALASDMSREDGLPPWRALADVWLADHQPSAHRGHCRRRRLRPAGARAGPRQPLQLRAFRRRAQAASASTRRRRSPPRGWCPAGTGPPSGGRSPAPDADTQAARASPRLLSP